MNDIESTQGASPPATDGTVAQTPAEQSDSSELSAARNSIVPGYENLGELGRGGMGIVYKAKHLKLNRIVALKMILRGEHASRDALARFLAEAEAVAKLQHPNIVQIHDSGTHNGLPYFTLEFIDGGTLAAAVRENPLTATDAARLVEQIARGMQYAHEHGVVHRDLKPDNVLLSFSGKPKAPAPTTVASGLPLNEVVPKIADFGLAKILGEPGAAAAGDEGLTHTGAVMGTPGYMSPEQARGDKAIGPATDIWALGAILYRLVTGRAPFVGASYHEVIRQVIHEDPISPSQLFPGLPRDVATICLKCLHKDPARRYASAAALADDLTRWLKGEPIHARPVGSVERGVKWVRRNAVVSAAALAVMLAMAVGTGVSWWKYREAKAQEAFAKGETTKAENAQAAEAERVKERDVALAKEAERVKERDAALAKEAERVKERDAALATAADRAKDLKYQLGTSSLLLANAAYENGDVTSARERLDKVPTEQRKFEWHYLARQAEGGIFTLKGHTHIVSSVAFSPDGTRIVTGSEDKTAKVWDARSGAPVLDLKGHTGVVMSVAYSPDGTRIVTGSVDKTAKVWDARTGASLLDLKGHAYLVSSVAFSPDGTRIVTGSWDKTAKVWDARSGAPVLDLKGHTHIVSSVAYSLSLIHI